MGGGARRKGEGGESYFATRGAKRCPRERKGRVSAAVSPPEPAMSALQSGWRWRPQGRDGRACGAVRSGSGSGLRAAPLLARLWLLAPTPGSHMTPAPLALRASRGWRGK
ncbi:uncharacterized protein FLJ13197 [Thomomys bottae]